MSRTSLAALALAGALAAAPALAQGLGESTLRATISQSIEADTNYNLDVDSPGTSYFGDTRLGLDLLQDTGTEQFSLGLDTGLRALWEADEDFEFTFASPTTASAGYSQQWASGYVSGNLRFRQREVDFLDDISFDVPFEEVDGVLVPVPDSLDQVEEDAVERRYDANVALALATDRPSSYRFSVQATRFDYSDTGEDLVNRTQASGDALWTLRLNPVLSSAVLGVYEYYEDDDDTTVRVGELDAGLIYTPSEILSLNFGLGYADRERRGDIVEDESGPVVRAGINYQVLDEFSLVANARVSDAAPETRLSGNLRADYALPQGSLYGRLSQDFTGDDEGQEVRITTAGIGLTRPINNVSSMTFDVAYGLQVNEDDPDAPDIQRTDFSAIYTRSITELVFANVGYRFRWRDEDDTATSNAVFVTLGRAFETSF